MLQRNSKLGLHELVGHELVVYPFGEMYRGVFLDEAQRRSFESYWHNLFSAVCVVFIWMFVLFIISSVLSAISKGASEVILIFGSMQCFWLIYAERSFRAFYPGSHAVWTSDSPIDRERAGLLIVPSYPVAGVAIVGAATVVLSVFTYLYWALPPPRISEATRSAKVAALAEYAVIALGGLAFMIWRNSRSASRAKARRSAEEP